MYDRDRASPKPLAAKPPIAQPIFGHAFPPTCFFGEIYCGVDCFLSGRIVKSGEMIDPFHFFRFRRNKRDCIYRRGVVERKEGVDYRQIVFAAKIKVALVMCGTGKDCTGAIVHQNKVGDPDRQFPFGIQRMPGLDSRIKTQLRCGFDGFFRGAAFARLDQKRCEFRVVLFQFL